MGYPESIIQFLLSRFENRYLGRGEKYTAHPASVSFVLSLRLLPGDGLSGSVVTFDEKCAINGKNC
jgi:hypothetical protein